MSTAPAAASDPCCSSATRCKIKRASVLRRTFDLMWREAMVELVDALEAEDPALSRTAPQAHTRAAPAGPGPAGLLGLVLALGAPVSWRLLSRSCALTPDVTLTLLRCLAADQAVRALERGPAPAGPALHGRRTACAAHEGVRLGAGPARLGGRVRAPPADRAEAGRGARPGGAAAESRRPARRAGGRPGTPGGAAALPGARRPCCSLFQANPLY